MTHTKTDEMKTPDEEKMWTEINATIPKWDATARGSFIAGVEWREANPSPAVVKMKLALEHYRAIEKDETSFAHQALSDYEKETAR